MPSDGRRPVLSALVVVALIGVLLSTAWAWLVGGFSLDSLPESRDQHLAQALGFGLGVALLAAALVPMRLLASPRWLAVTVLASIALLGLAGLHQIQAADAAPVRPEHGAPTVVLQQFFAAPTTWPMLLLVVVTPVVRGWSLLARRSARAR